MVVERPSRRPRPRPRPRAARGVDAGIGRLDRPASAAALYAATSSALRLRVLREQRVGALLHAVAAVDVVRPVLGAGLRRDLVVARLRHAARHAASPMSISVALVPPSTLRRAASSVAMRVALELLGYTRRRACASPRCGFSCCGSLSSRCYRRRRASRSGTHDDARPDGIATAVTGADQSDAAIACRRVVHEPQLGDIGDRLGEREQRAQGGAPRRGGSCRRRGARRTRRRCRRAAPRRRPRADETAGSRRAVGCRGCAARCGAARPRDRTRACAAACASSTPTPNRTTPPSDAPTDRAERQRARCRARRAPSRSTAVARVRSSSTRVGVRLRICTEPSQSSTRQAYGALAGSPSRSGHRRRQHRRSSVGSTAAAAATGIAATARGPPPPPPSPPPFCARHSRLRPPRPRRRRRRRLRIG